MILLILSSRERQLAIQQSLGQSVILFRKRHCELAFERAFSLFDFGYYKGLFDSVVSLLVFCFDWQYFEAEIPMPIIHEGFDLKD